MQQHINGIIVKNQIVMNWIMSFKDSKLKLYPLPTLPLMTVFRGRGFKEVIKVEWDHKGGPLIQ